MGLTHKNTYTLAGPVGVWLTGSRTAWKNGSLCALGENQGLQADLSSDEFSRVYSSWEVELPHRVSLGQSWVGGDNSLRGHLTLSWRQLSISI